MRNSLWKAALGAGAAVLSLGIAGPAISQDASDISEGRRIFNSYCFLCHGGNGIGEGILATKLEINDQVVDLTEERFETMSEADIASLIAGYDRGESMMPKWGEVLGEKEISQVAAYVKALGPEASYQIGKNLYFRHCAACHGSNGKGGGAIAKQLEVTETIPDLSSDAFRTMSRENMVSAIEGHDRMDGNVPDFGAGFTPRALGDLAMYLVRYSPSGLGALGNAANGQRIFDQNCIGCHGAQGKGDGVLAGLLDVAMVDLTSASQLELSDMQIIHTISRGQGVFMPAWFGELNQYEIRDVAAYVRELYQPAQ